MSWSLRRDATDGGESIACAGVVVATGTVPVAGIAKASGLACAKGVLVDAQMRTSDPAILAIGECAEYAGATWGTTASAGAMAFMGMDLGSADQPEHIPYAQAGYVVVAYLVGARLTRAQVVMLNLNYTIWSLFLLACGGNLIANGMTWENAAKTPEAPVLFVPQAIYFHYCIGILLLITSLWFMWSVRHTKTD